MRAPSRPRPLLPPGTGALAPFVDARVLREAEVQVAGAVARTVPGAGDEALLATALCVRALQLGHVCVELDRVAATVRPDALDDVDAAGLPGSAGDPTAIAAPAPLPWPEPARWATALSASPAVAVRDPATGDADQPLDPDLLRPLVFDGRRVYLERYWRYERVVGDALLAGADGDGPAAVAPEAVAAAVDRAFGPAVDAQGGPDLQRRAAEVALGRRITVLAGGPGTGKTHTVARLLATLRLLSAEAGRPLEVALAAPTGKAAARMTEAVRAAAEGGDGAPGDAQATTLHRLLGTVDGIRFRHDRTDPLPHDVVVVDETSMVGLPLMARLLEALRPDARLVLVGDPFQLASVEAGAVLGDVVGPAARRGDAVVGPLADGIVVLRRTHRFGAGSAIAALADAVRTGDADGALAVLADPAAGDVVWVDPADAAAVAALRAGVAEDAAAVVAAARAGDAAGALARAGARKVLCGTRAGPGGTWAWQADVEQRLRSLVPGLRTDERWYVGRPVMVTRNDHITKVFNGDTGVVVRAEGRPGRAEVALAGAEGVRRLAPSQLAAVDTWWASTIHKSQGSELDHAVVSLPAAGSRVLSNELLYTGITRGREQVTVVASEAAIRFAVAHPVARASGLQARCWG